MLRCSHKNVVNFFFIINKLQLLSLKERLRLCHVENNGNFAGIAISFDCFLCYAQCVFLVTIKYLPST